MSLVYEIPFWETHQWKTFLKTDKDGLCEAYIELGCMKIYSFAEFAKEVFCRLYSYDSAEALEAIRPEDKWAAKLHEELSDNPQFKALLEDTVGNHYFSGLATTMFLKSIEKQLRYPDNELKNPSDIRSEVIACKEAGQEGMAASLIVEGKAAVAAIAEWTANLLDGGTFPADIIVAVALEAAQDSINDAIDTFHAIGSGLGVGNNEGTFGSLQDKVSIASMIASNSKLILMMKQAGRLKRLAARKIASRSTDSNQSIVSVQNGATLSRLVPSQLAMMRTPALKPLFLKGLSEKSLLEYKMGGKEKSTQGPIIYLVDGSGSMHGARHVWAMALALAMIGIAHRQKRDCYVVHFNARVTRTDEFLATDNLDQRKLINCISHSPSGGTSWTTPLDKAVSLIQQSKRFHKADVCLLTDGRDDVDQCWLDEFRKVQKDMGFTLYGILIGKTLDSGEAENLEQLVDLEHLIAIPDLEKDADIAQLFEI